MGLEIKEIHGKNILRYKKLCAQLFRCGNNKLNNDEKYIKELIEEDDRKEEGVVRLGAFHNGVLYAALELIPYDIYLDGKILKMYGVGGVVSSPECPEKGAVKLLFKKSFKIMRKNGSPISHLYPFEENYYRQYGYEVSCDYSRWRIPVESIVCYREGTLKGFDNSVEMKKDIIKIYEDFASKRNLSFARNEKQWNDFFEKRRAYSSDYFSYIHYTGGMADGYVCYTTKENAERPMDLIAENFWFTSFEGLRGILSYFVREKSYIDYVEVKLPFDVDLSAIIDSCGGWGKRNTIRISGNKGTSKIVDVEKIFKNLKYMGEGEVTIKIKDDYCEWNDDIFNVKFGEKTIVNRGGNADIEMDIKSFTSLILGRYNLDNSRIFSDVRIYGNYENLEKIFYKKNCWIEEHF